MLSSRSERKLLASNRTYNPRGSHFVSIFQANFISGDRVGFGFVRGGCGHCDYCVQGHYWHCEKKPRVYAMTDLDQGSFASHAVWPDTLLHRIPDQIDSDYAAPFLCAGQTVFTPMLRYGIKPTDRVGVIGIGGLGHLAIQFASKMGCTVVVFSSSESKREEAMKLGASEFYITGELGKVKPAKGIDHLFATTSKHPDWAT